MNGWTCKKIYETICEHTDCVSIFICIHDWANKEGGQLVVNNVEEDVFLTLFGNNVPDDWCISNGSDGWIDIGFLFQ